MSRLHFALMSLVLGLTAQPLFATTYYVAPPLANPCTSAKGGFEVFPSIQYAVTHVPEGSTINICPGTYYEQVTISQPLTLQGISGNNNSSQVIIAMPPDGLTTTSSLKFGTIAAQVEVTKGPVNITGVTVDGTASSSNCPNGFYVGIFYSGDTNADASGASGVVNGVETRYQSCGSADWGLGILAEYGEQGDGKKSFTIENSNIHDQTNSGIFAYGSGLIVSIKNNNVASTTPNSEATGIVVLGTTGSVSNNNVDSFQTGVYVDAEVDVSDNTVGNSSLDGIDVFEAGATVTSNRIWNSSRQGIGLSTGGATIKNNIINSTFIPNNPFLYPIGIEFGCNTNTVSENIINGAYTGIDSVPAAFNGVNTFYNVPTVRTGGC
jgi:hypothetical protein